ncbi:TetR/AcrR family transcriptional regulator [Demequina aurantiaca]|uniref:TetR/AcrR family transcriptional regulator n=1 Tax=Demequina aurantiaca TaxID=676200 RepID=UPI000784744E|nr:TetR/AcrR family transcriptional regulator [Demequina aurantiaca]
MTSDAVVRKTRGPYAKSKATKTAILDAALEVFSEGGFRAGSLSEIASRVNMSEAGLLHHFPNKSALLTAVLDRRDEHSREDLEIDLDTQSGREVLGAFTKLMQNNADAPGVVALFTTLSAEATSSDHPAHEYFVDRYADLRRIAVEATVKAETEGSLRPGVDPKSSAIRIIALMDGLQIQWLLDPGSVDMGEEIRQAVNDILVDPI